MCGELSVLGLRCEGGALGPQVTPLGCSEELIKSLVIKVRRDTRTTVNTLIPEDVQRRGSPVFI